MRAQTVGLLAVLAAVAACGGGKGAASGAEGGHCYPNGTCNAGLTCFSDLCVRYEGGSPSGGTVGSTGEDAAAGAGGTGGAAQGGVDGSSSTAGTGGGGGHSTGGGGVAGASVGSGGASGGADGAAGRDGAVTTDAGPEAPAEVAAAADPCDRKTWALVASFVCDTVTCGAIASAQKDPMFAIDGDPATRYTSGRAQGSEGPERVVLSFSRAVSVTGLRLLTIRTGDGPAAYLVERSTDGTTFEPFSPPSAGAGSDDLAISFPAATSAKALRITQTGTKDVSWWSINELDVTGCLSK